MKMRTRLTVLTALALIAALGVVLPRFVELDSEETARSAELDVTLVSTPTKKLAQASEAATKRATDKWGTLKGRFIIDGAAPKLKPLRITANPQFCGNPAPPNEEVVIGPKGGIANVAVWVRSKSVKVHPDLKAVPTGKVQMANKGCKYEPRMVAMRAGQTLELLNPDAVSHNVKWDSRNKPGNVMIPAGGSKDITVLTKSEKRAVPVSCSLHPWMNGYVIVKDHPYVAVSAADGTFEIKDLPAGTKLEFQFWHEMGYISEVDNTVVPGKWKRGRIKYTVKEGENDLGDIKVKAKMFK